MRSQARQDCRTRIALRPIENFREQVPVRLFAQVGKPRFGACHDDAVKPVLPKLVERRIKAVEMPLAAICARHASKRVQLDINRKISRRDVEKLKELQLGIFESGIGHVVDQRNTKTMSPHATIDRTARARDSLCPPARNSTAVNN